MKMLLSNTLRALSPSYLKTSKSFIYKCRFYSSNSNNRDPLDELLKQIQSKFESKFEDNDVAPSQASPDSNHSKSSKSTPSLPLKTAYPQYLPKRSKNHPGNPKKFIDHSLSEHVFEKWKPSSFSDKRPPFTSLVTVMSEFQRFWHTNENENIESRTRTPLSTLLSTLTHYFHRPDLSLSLFFTVLRVQQHQTSFSIVHTPHPGGDTSIPTHCVWEVVSTPVWNQVLKATYEHSRNSKELSRVLKSMWGLGISFDEGTKTIVRGCLNDLEGFGVHGMKERLRFKETLKKYKL